MAPEHPAAGSSHTAAVRAHYAGAAAGYQQRFGKGLLGWVRRRERQSVLRLLSPVRGDRLLDAGCGSGFDAVPLIERGCVVTGVDLVAEMVAIARERGVDASVADLHTLALGRRFDKVLCSGALEFCEHPARVLERLCDHVAPGGRLVVLYPTRTWMGRAYRAHHRRHGLSIALFTPEGIERELCAHGLLVMAHELPTPFTGVVRADRLRA